MTWFERIRIRIRGRVAGLLAIGVLASGCGAPAGAGQSEGTLLIGVQQEYSLLPELVAVDQGFFEDEGFGKTEFVPFTALPALLAAVDKGQVDVGLQTPVTVHQYNQSARAVRLVFFAPGQAMNPVYSARKGSAIPNAADGDWRDTAEAWRGKKVGVPALGGLVDLLTRKLAKDVGLEPDRDFALITTGTGQAQIAALESGSVDVVIGDPFGASMLAKAGGGKTVLDISHGEGPQELTGTFQSGMVTSRQALQKDPERFAAYARAKQRAVDFVTDPANEAAVKETITSRLNVAPEVADLLYTYVGDFDFVLDQKTVDRTVDVMVGMGLLKNPGPEYGQLVQLPETH